MTTRSTCRAVRGRGSLRAIPAPAPEARRSTRGPRTRPTGRAATWPSVAGASMSEPRSRARLLGRAFGCAAIAEEIVQRENHLAAGQADHSDRPAPDRAPYGRLEDRERLLRVAD